MVGELIYFSEKQHIRVHYLGPINYFQKSKSIHIL